MRWSSNLISKNFAACFILLVSSSSARLGFKLPEGWLWQRIRLTAFFSSAFFRINLGSATVPVIPPWLTISKWVTLFAWFKNRTANSSFEWSFKMIWMKFATSRLSFNACFPRMLPACLLLPSSRAAAIAMALASPMPLTLMMSFTESFPSSFRLFFPNKRISFARSTADFSLVPWCMRMASNSESLKAAAVLLSNFSLGLSSFAQFLIEYFSACIFRPQ